MNGNREPEGYAIQSDPERAAVVVRIFERYAATTSFLNIASDLNADGAEPPRAHSKGSRPKVWRKESVRSILQNRAYLGEFSFGRKRWSTDPATRKRCYTLRTEGVQTDSRPHLAIVPEVLFNAVQARKRVVKKRAASGRKTEHPFSGLLFCHGCGSRMVFVGGSTKAYYICNGAHSGREAILLPRCGWA